MRPFTALALVGSVVLSACAPQTADKATDTGFIFSFDLDGDGFGAPADCDDADPAVNPLARDVAGDGLDVDCDAVDGVDRDRDGVASIGSGGTDCDDDNAARSPALGDVGVDGIDQDCSGVDGPDADGDGVATQLAGGGDCDDSDATIHPGVLDDVTDGVDQDCSGLDGDDATPVVTDVDGDGYDSAQLGGVDCDDANAAVNPGATDLAGDSSDQNCDGLDGFDGDQDGIAAGWSGGLDCDDTDASVRPGADDASTDGVDQDCSGLDGPDVDGDGYAAQAGGGTDCDDTNPSANPEREDFAVDGVDDDCDGVDGSDAPPVVEDVDGDGYTDVLYGGTDCDDWNAGVSPVVTDLVGDTVDQNCDGIDGQDADGDGAAAAWSGGVDCDDADPTVNPGGLDTTVDGIDQDCSGLDGSADAPPNPDVDHDGFVAIALGGDDCDDADATVNAAVFDRAGDGVDGNCDGVDGHDEDHDGVAAWWSLGGDCDDGDVAIKPGAADLSVDGVDNDCNGFDGLDLDHDGEAAEFVGTVAAGGQDCNDADPHVNTRGDDVAVDGIDQDCDEIDGNDLPPPRDDDRDGAVSAADGGDDCQDHNAAVNPVATDIVGDGVDQNCDGLDGRDEDRDGFAARETGGIDCDDRTALVNPGAPDTLATVADENCDGVNGVDLDQDGFADGEGDCDDHNSVIHDGAPDRVGDSVDQDCDGLDGVDADADDVASLASGGTDCDDTRAAVFPAAFDLTVDGIDQDCSGVDGVDDDGDGYASLSSGGTDCDDTPVGGVSIRPGASDTTLDTIDQDCDGVDANDANRDADGDGFVSAVFGGPDCDDHNAALNPAATDLVGDGGDQNCDGLDGFDGDQDGFAASWSGGTDCDDDASDDMAGHVPAADVHPSTVSSVTPDLAGDGTDQDCDGVDGVDGDGDGYASVLGGGTDCDDADAAVHPGVSDGASAGDQDCDGLVDEDLVRDLDGDGFDSVLLGGSDCNDLNAAVNPMATDLAGDTFDQNCDGVDGYDGDHDGVAAPWSGGDDCDDTRASVRPGLTTDMTIDGTDQDCDGVDGLDADHDGYATLALFGGNDCDDTRGDIHPGVTDLPDGVDNDCDGAEGEDAPAPTDYDRDGFVTSAEGGADCDDHNGAVNPYATDVLGDGRDQNCDGVDGTDADGDGQASLLSGGVDCDDDDATVYTGAAEHETSPVETLYNVGSSVPACTRDEDGDGWGDDTFALDTYYVINGGYWVLQNHGSDCDDSRADRAPDLYDYDANDGLDANCDGLDADDNDHDGSFDAVAGGPDCDDTNPEVREDARLPELCGTDADRDGQVGAVFANTGYGQTTGGGAGGGPVGNPGDMVTSCDVPEETVCVEFRNDPTGEAWCADLQAAGFNTTFSAGACPTEGRVDGVCSVDADASPEDAFSTDVWLYYYGIPAYSAATHCGQALAGAWSGAGGTGTVPTQGSDCDDADPTVYTGSLPLEGADVCAHDYDGDGYGWDVDGGTDCVEYVPAYAPAGDAFITARVVTTYGTQSSEEVGNLDIDLHSARAIHPGVASQEPSLCTLDVDGDGYGVMPGQVRTFVDEGTTMVVTLLAFSFDAGTDCDDEDMDVFPGALANEPASVCAQDGDGDGYGAFTDGGHDCDDTDAANVPTPEVCNGIDDNCDGTVDNNGIDVDQDGSPSCLDCDDQNPNRSPLLREACDGEVDNDCNVATRENLDSDGDGFSVCAGDCAENDFLVHPGSLPWESNPGLCAHDADHDGWGNAAEGGSDCDDHDSMMHPDRDNPTICGRDMDMDGYLSTSIGGTDCDDENAAVKPDTLNGACGVDMDFDGFVGMAYGGTDCNDNANFAYPGAAEQEPTLCAADEDGDGWASEFDGGHDCVDVAVYSTLVLDGNAYVPYTAYGSQIYPGAAEHEPSLCAADVDGDGYGEARDAMDRAFDPGADCDDGQSLVHPGTGETGVCGTDADYDGFVSTTDGGSDCDDSSYVYGSKVTDADCDGVEDNGCAAEMRVMMGTQVLLARSVSLGEYLAPQARVLISASGSGSTFDDFAVYDTVLPPPLLLAMSAFDAPPAGAPDEWLTTPGTYLASGMGLAYATDNTFQFADLLPVYGGLRAQVDVAWSSQTEQVAVVFADGTTSDGFPMYFGSICAGGPNCGASYPTVSVGYVSWPHGYPEAHQAAVALPSGIDPHTFNGTLSVSMTPSAACFDMDGDGQTSVAAGGYDCDDLDPSVYLGAATQEFLLCAADADGDGYASVADGGRDCNDSDAGVGPGPSHEAFGNCLPDYDGDGWGDIAAGGHDCDDANMYVHPDGSVQGVCGVDADADGLVRVADGGSDCNDTVTGRGSCAVSAGSVTWPSFTFNATTGWTVEAWVYAGASAGDSGHFFRTWGCGAADATMSYYSDLYGFFAHGTVSTPRAETGIGVRTNQWVHVAATYTSTGSKLFVAGSLVGTSTSSTSGTCASASTGLSGNLLVDAMRISDGVLYTTSFTPPTTFAATASTKALYQFDEGYGAITSDSSSQRKNGTWSDAPSWVPGR